MSKLDKLFKEKLENHRVLPSSRAWEKVESRISKKNNLSVTLRLAAGVLLAGLLITFVVNEFYMKESPALANQNTNSKTTQSSQSTDELKSPATAKEKVETKQPQNHRRHTTGSEPRAEKLIQPEATVTPEPVVIVPEETLIAEAQPEPVKTKKMVLVYSLPTVERKSDPPGEISGEEEKKTGLQRVMDVAMEVRNGDNPLGELREAKDELFALDFRKDKNKSKN